MMKTALICLLTVISSSSYAGIMTFSDRTDFETATGATMVGPIPGGPGLTSLASFSIGDLTFTSEPPPSINIVRDWSLLISEPFDLAINGVEQFNVDSGADIFSFGFDFHEPSLTTPPEPQFPDTCNTATCVDSNFEISLLNGAVEVGSFEFMRPDDSLEFVGVWSTEAFNRIEVRELVGTADNEFFGNFSTGTRAAPIPEPSIIALFAAGLFGLGFTRRRMRR